MSDTWQYKPIGPRIEELNKSDLPAGMADEQGEFPFYCSSSRVRRIDQAIASGPAILMGTGGVATVHHGKGLFSYSTDTWAFKVSDVDTNVEFLYRQIEHLLPRIDYFAFGGSGLRHLDKAYIKSLELSVPSIKFQKKAADIVNSIENSILEGEGLVSKLRAIKVGMLCDLLERGIGPDGGVRPSAVESPGLYKESPLGRIPKEWEVKPLLELLCSSEVSMRSGPFGSELLKRELVEEGVPLLGIDNVHVEKFVSKFNRFVSQEKYSELERYAVRPSDLMITIMGTVGRCCLVPDDIGEALSSKHTWTVSIDKELYSPYLAMLQINYSPWVLKHFSRDQQGGTMAAIRSETLKSTLFPVPGRYEQTLIEGRLRGVSELISLEMERIQKQCSEKHALMNGLFVGCARDFH